MSEKETDFLDGMTGSAAPERVEAPGDELREELGDKGVADPVKPDAQAEPPAAKTDQEDRVPIAALKAERSKRQALERELEEARKRQAEPEKRAEQVPFYENPELYLEQTLTRAEQAAQQRLYAALEADAREQFADYDEVMEALHERVKQNPALSQQIFGAPNPAKAAYRLGKQLAELDQMQDPDAYRQKLEAEFRAKWDAEQRAKEEARQRAVDEVPPDLAAARSSTGAAPAKPGQVFEELFKKP